MHARLVSILCPLLACGLALFVNRPVTGQQSQYPDWKKAIIVDKRLYTVIPVVPAREPVYPKMAKVHLPEQSGADVKILFYTLPFPCYDYISQIRQGHLCPQELTGSPTAWDISGGYLVAFSLNLGAREYLLHLLRLEVSSDGLESLVRGSKNFGNYNIQTYARSVVPFFGAQPFAGSIYYDLCAETNKKIQVFVAQGGQFIVWGYDGERWDVAYAFSASVDGPFKVCQFKEKLYVLFEKGGIYSIDIAQAKAKGKIILEKAKHPDKADIIYWAGFDEQSVKEKSVSAKKISDLKAEAFVIDKDSQVGFVVAGSTLTDITDLKRRVKLSPIDTNLKGEEKDSARLQAIIKAVKKLEDPSFKPDEDAGQKPEPGKPGSQDTQQPPKKGESPSQPKPEERDKPEPMKSMLPQSRDLAGEDANWLLPGLIIIGVVIAGVVILLLLRRRGAQ
jgi:hypothetical protein